MQNGFDKICKYACLAKRAIRVFGQMCKYDHSMKNQLEQFGDMDFWTKVKICVRAQKYKYLCLTKSGNLGF